MDDVWPANVNDGETKGKTDNPKHCIHCKNVKALASNLCKNTPMHTTNRQCQRFSV